MVGKSGGRSQSAAKKLNSGKPRIHSVREKEEGHPRPLSYSASK